MEKQRLTGARTPRIGEVYMMQFNGTGCEQNGWRPGVVFQNNTGNAFSPNIIALPLTSSIKKETQPTHVVIRAKDSGLTLDSMVLCENPECMSKHRIGKYLTTLSDEHMRDVAAANLIATSAVSYLDIASLLDIWATSVRLNVHTISQ